MKQSCSRRAFITGTSAGLGRAIAVALAREGYDLALTALIWFMHRANIQRLLAGTEPKIGRSRAAAPEGY